MFLTGETAEKVEKKEKEFKLVRYNNISWPCIVQYKQSNGTYVKLFILCEVYDVIKTSCPEYYNPEELQYEYSNTWNPYQVCMHQAIDETQHFKGLLKNSDSKIYDLVKNMHHNTLICKKYPNKYSNIRVSY